MRPMLGTRTSYNTCLPGILFAAPQLTIPFSIMIDTITFGTFRLLAPHIEHALQHARCYKSEEDGWYIKTVVKPSPLGSAPCIHFNGHHKGHAIHVSGQDGVIKCVTVSLPAQLHGFNGIQLKPGEAEKALKILDGRLEAISSPARQSMDIFRLDLCLNLSADPVVVLAAHRNAKHPGIRNHAQAYRNPLRYQVDELNTIRFAGRGINIILYNKAAKLRADSHSSKPVADRFLRVEVQFMKRKAVRTLLGVPKSLSTGMVDYQQAYRLFRSLMCGFRAETGGQPEFSLKALLALAENEDMRTPSGLTALEWYRQSVQPETFRKTQAECQRLQFTLAKFDWAERLPEHGPPETIDLYADGRTVLVPPPFWLPPVAVTHTAPSSFHSPAHEIPHAPPPVEYIVAAS